ncbi:hypothetical protein IE81DRAFT_142606 [Ceraceosorus guamensis]|uniref:Secreted protein n=1 Tax=Ceraceosorus guamensis TaxID=1522189 RepID=A0A316VWT5_9BASI|nr:hypothetical protein IE81DRAFT_142606 [Ceraceosorus guamensis]PWN42107.1 hypothetical protein IE81DRAFT_142606 [Ceraceosorus guamensis]
MKRYLDAHIAKAMCLPLSLLLTHLLIRESANVLVPRCARLHFDALRLGFLADCPGAHLGCCLDTSHSQASHTRSSTSKVYKKRHLCASPDRAFLLILIHRFDTILAPRSPHFQGERRSEPSRPPTRATLS